MSVRGPNNVGRAVQTDPTLFRHASAITEQKKCWELLAEKFDRFQTLRNNMQQHPTIERFHSRDQHLCKFMDTKESVYIRKEFNSHRTGLEHQGTPIWPP